jgi:hypothetical protein
MASLPGHADERGCHAAAVAGAGTATARPACAGWWAAATPHRCGAPSACVAVPRATACSWRRTTRPSGELRTHGVPVEVGDDNPAARVLRAHGLTSATVRTGIDRLVAEGVLPGPQPSDAELLATLGIDLDASWRS